MSVTLKDVAKEAGVHPTTVSSILNRAKGNSRFSEQTRNRVNQAAKSLGYAPNRIASSLRTRRTGTIGLVAGNIQNPFFASLSLQLEKALQNLGYDLVMTCHGTDSTQDENDLALMLLGKSVDGLLIWSEHRDGHTPTIHTNSSTPRVWLGHGPPNEPAVRIDILSGLQQALQFISSQGRSRIGYFAPTYARSAGLPQSRARILQQICDQWQFPPPVMLFFDEQSWDLGATVQAADPLVQKAIQHRLDAILSFNDVSAAAWALATHDIHFPHTLVGFDGSPMIKAWRPFIPHVDLHSHSLAQSASSLLINLIQKGNPPQSPHVIQPSFISHPP